MKDRVRKLELFIAYSHQDEKLWAQFETCLVLLRREGLLDAWHDRRIVPGREWAGKIDDALERADVVLVLVSPDFLASDYCYDIEMKRALTRHSEGTARVVPVILRPCDWQSSPFGMLQGFPRDGKPVAQYRDRDVGFAEVTRALRSLLLEIGQAADPDSTTALQSRSVSASPPRAGLDSDPNPERRRKQSGASKTTRRIFLCYRRHDSGPIVGRIYDRLARDFGEANVFKDIDNIPFGVDFVEYLDGEVQKCDVVFVVIGPQWLEQAASDSARLEDPNDFVRIEIASALRRTIPVVPILVDGAQMPRADELPEEIKPLARRNGTQIRHDPDFHSDMTRLLSRLG
jgi:hypothetical protein